MARATKKAHINFCKIENYKPHTGHVYSYEHHGQYYIGSTTDLNKRKQEHRTGVKAGNTKFLKKQLIDMDLIISITKYYKPSSIQTSVNCGN